MRLNYLVVCFSAAAILVISGCLSGDESRSGVRSENTPHIMSNPASLKLGNYQLDFILNSDYNKDFIIHPSRLTDSLEESVKLEDLDDDYRSLSISIEEFDALQVPSLDALEKDIISDGGYYGEITLHSSKNYTYMIKKTEKAFDAAGWVDNKAMLNVDSYRYSEAEFFAVLDSLKATRITSPIDSRL